MSQVIEHYRALGAQDTEHVLGCALPELMQGSLSISSEQCTQAELAEKLSAWQNANGWYQLANKTAVGFPERFDTFLEGEWNDEASTLRVTLLAPNRYGLTTFTLASHDTGEHGFRHVNVHVRSNLENNNAQFVRYRLWYAQEDHAWRPLAQQFIGFSKEAK